MILPYHVSCQARAHRMGRPSLDVMTLIPGLDVREGNAKCCGLAGTYGYKAEKYEIAMQVGADAFRFVRAQGDAARMVTSDSEICRWQLQHGTQKSARAPIEILAAAYGLYDLDQRRLKTK
jgi:glycerol-3-phosphate dehydrogenase subunit C